MEAAQITIKQKVSVHYYLLLRIKEWQLVVERLPLDFGVIIIKPQEEEAR
jgi:hypothetical protein